MKAKQKSRQKLVMGVALLIMVIAAFLLPSNISGVEWEKVQATYF